MCSWCRWVGDSATLCATWFEWFARGLAWAADTSTCMPAASKWPNWLTCRRWTFSIWSCWILGVCAIDWPAHFAFSICRSGRENPNLQVVDWHFWCQWSFFGIHFGTVSAWFWHGFYFVTLSQRWQIVEFFLVVCQTRSLVILAWHANFVTFHAKKCDLSCILTQLTVLTAQHKNKHDDNQYENGCAPLGTLRADGNLRFHHCIDGVVHFRQQSIDTNYPVHRCNAGYHIRQNGQRIYVELNDTGQSAESDNSEKRSFSADISRSCLEHPHLITSDWYMCTFKNSRFVNIEMNTNKHRPGTKSASSGFRWIISLRALRTTAYGAKPVQRHRRKTLDVASVISIVSALPDECQRFSVN